MSVSCTQPLEIGGLIFACRLLCCSSRVSEAHASLQLTNLKKKKRNEESFGRRASVVSIHQISNSGPDGNTMKRQYMGCNYPGK